ncbi:MAG TPA: alanine--tRNA ligase-related protein, partial [Dehalococcoidia bacterium]|nr:alanine--tRNA ligase-related protein [Dehalococcoidia bacterium]
MNTRDVRDAFTRFFAERGHRRIPSSSLIPPPEEKSLLFTTAGMLQMKPYFMGLARPPAHRLTSIQKCFRTSDIEEVGDNRHCTFFEMLGNFSVGDYFKADVIPWAWELLTAPQPNGIGLDPSRIWATIFDEDDEAHDLWRGVGLPEDRIVRYGEEHNYWFMGRVGPCGPNTEINYDFGEYEGWAPHACHPQCEEPGCRRFIELWNLVFMTLYQDEDGSRRPLPQQNVDTGAGLERWSMPLMWESGTDWQGNIRDWKQPPTIFDTDMFQPILARVGELAGKPYYEASDAEQRAMRVVAEHARAATFLIADGVTPANDGRGYVLRRLIRRGTSFGQRLNPGQQYLEATASAVIETMGDEYPDLHERAVFVAQTLRSEEVRFAGSVNRGVHLIYEQQIPNRAKKATLITQAESRIMSLLDEMANPPTDFATAEELMRKRSEITRQLSNLKSTLEFDVSAIPEMPPGIEPDEKLEWAIAEIFDTQFPEHDFKLEGLDSVCASGLRFFMNLENRLPHNDVLYPGSHSMLFAVSRVPNAVPPPTAHKRAVDEAREILTNLFMTLRQELRRFTGKELFILQDRLGVPSGLAVEIASEEGLTVDDRTYREFEALMDEQRTRSRAATRFAGDAERIQAYADLGLPQTLFLGYEGTQAFATVAAIFRGAASTHQIRDTADELVEVVLDRTPFYAEGGGQVGDRGVIASVSAGMSAPADQAGVPATFNVEDTQAVGEGGIITHIGRLESGHLRVGDAVFAAVDEDVRADTMRNHTATHILHAALRKIVGAHVRQAGSLVTPDRLRFDFTHLEALTPDQLREVEALTNKAVREDMAVHTDHSTYEEAIEAGALAFFGEKYADTVRVVGVCAPEADACFSKELCGGTHVHSSGEVGAIIITAETSIGAG